MSDTITTTIQVAGMTCAHCVGAVTAELTKLDGVESVEVDLPTGNVTIASLNPLADAVIVEAIDEAGYELVR